MKFTQRLNGFGKKNDRVIPIQTGVLHNEAKIILKKIEKLICNSISLPSLLVPNSTITNEIFTTNFFQRNTVNVKVIFS